jgi:chromosome segregation ATPase
MAKTKPAKRRNASLDIILSTMERGFASVAADIEATDEKIDGVKTKMIDQFEHVDAQFRSANDHLRDISSELAAIHRRIERLEEPGASNAGFAKEIDHALKRIAAIEKHLGINKKIAASPTSPPYLCRAF